MRTMLMLIACLSLSFLTGCKAKNSEPAASRDEWNRERFASFPPAVGDGFMRDYPQTTVVKVTSYDISSGRTIYGVNYIGANAARFTTYAESGQRISPPVPPILTN